LEKGKLLIIDDDINLCLSMQKNLELLEYHVDYVINGETSRTKLKDNLYNVIILDIKLPDINGIELLFELKQEYSCIEFIIITGFASLNDAISALNKEAYAFLEKPFEFPLLESMITKAIEKQTLQKEIKSSEKKYRGLFEKSPYSIILSDFDGKIIDINSVTEKIFSFAKDELLNKDNGNISLIFRDYSKSILEEAKKSINTEFPQFKEIIGFNKNGEQIWVRFRTCVIMLDNNPIIQMLIEDISKKISSEIEFKKMEKQLQELNISIQKAPMAIVISNYSGNILKVNKKSEDMFNKDSSELIDDTIYDLVHPDYKNILITHYANTINEIDKINKTEIRLNSNSKYEKTVEIISTLLNFDDYSLIQSFVLDITERKQYENYQIKLLGDLQTSLEFKSKFLANMSHELRTPLNAILGFSQLLLDESYGKINDKQEDFLTDINSAGDHLLSLVNTVLDLSKIEARKMAIDPEEIDLAELIKEIKAVIKPLYTQKSLELNIKNIRQDETIFADHLRFKQILYNLLSNAIKFTRKGSISLEFSQDNDNWKFKIIDTGIGIRETDNHVIFKEFGRAKDTEINQIQGAGLGLALTKKLIDLHSGKIWFESEFGKGTTFFFTIPKRRNE